MRTRGWHITFVALAVAGSLLGAPDAHAKKVSLEWKSIKGAAQYELQIRSATSGSVGKVLVKKQLEKPRWKGELPFGVYTYEVRGIDRIKRPGQWSEAHPLVVMARPPELLEPSDGQKLSSMSSTSSVLLKWKHVEGASKFHVKVTRDGTAVYDEIVPVQQVKLPGLGPGKYKWEVTAVLEPAEDRAPASLAGRKWETKPSDSSVFRIERRELSAPTPIYPKSTLRPPASGKLPFRWSRVDGAEAYRIKLVPLDGREPASAGEREYTARGTAIVIDQLHSGSYRWEVRAIASYIDDNSAPGVVGPRSEAEFTLDRNAGFTSGGGYFAISTMLAPYVYQVSNATLNAATSSSALTMRLSGEYWFLPRFGVSAAAEDTFFQINQFQLDRKNFELTGKTRLNLTDGRYGWSLAPKLGLEGREYFEFFSMAQGLVPTSFMALGPAIGFDLRKDFNDRLSVGLKASYFVPVSLMGVASGSSITSQASFRNIGAGLQGLYWFNRQWGLGLGVYSELRSVSYMQPNAATPDMVYTDGTYFFSSLLYRFGR